MDGTVAAEREFPAADADVRQNVTLSAEVPAGKHRVRIENRGADWVVVSRIALSPFGPALKALGKVGKESAALWVRRAARGDGGNAAGPSSVAGTVTIPGLAVGTYRVLWWDTRTGRKHSEAGATVVRGQPLVLTTPAVAEDMAAWVVRRR